MKEPTDQRTKFLETLLLQVLRDAVAQDVLMEWWGPISDALEIEEDWYERTRELHPLDP